jgi:putative transposase
MANLASRVAKGNWPMIATLVRSIFEQPDRDATWEQLGDVVDKLTSARVRAHRHHHLGRRG